jgi:hypothetical protein
VSRELLGALVLVEKSKLPKGHSYPLRSSVLAAAFSDANVTIESHLVIAPSAIFFDAHFWPPNEAVPHERLYVRVSSVVAQQSRAAREFVETSVVPDLIAWLEGILSLPKNSPVRQSQQYFRREWPRT